jgi:hypothetical protein
MANFVRRIQNYTNHYKPGPVNLNADALSGNPVMITSLQDNTSAKLEDNFVRFYYENQEFTDLPCLNNNIFSKSPNALHFSKDLDENNLLFESSNVKKFCFALNTRHN